MKTDKCPQCGSPRVIPGRIFGALSGVKPFYFRPKGLKLLTLSTADVRTDSDGFWACSECGLLWSSVDQKELKEIVETAGTAKLKARVTA